MTAVARGAAASAHTPADPPAVRGALRVLGFASLVLGLATAATAFVTLTRPAAMTGWLAALAVIAVVVGALVQDGARRTGHRTSGPATAGLMLGVAALGILAVSFVPAALQFGVAG
ncbi:hypothetical protein ACFQ58_04645 [Agromyces sp. NPDC056523]|uniref:hypothetical protein n=1 Tax=Agromyces sp. NPDC056523 TaxID=3345850 RepID=UPI00366D1097